MPAYNLIYRGNYEVSRSYRYKDHKTEVIYSEHQVQAAYKRWAHCPDHDRSEEWDVYCDVRDSKPIGTNATIREMEKRKAGRRVGM